MSLTAATIDKAVARWVEEAKAFPPREAYRLLHQKARFVERQLRRCAGPAWDLARGRDALVAAARNMTERTPA